MIMTDLPLPPMNIFTYIDIYTCKTHYINIEISIYYVVIFNNNNIIKN